MEQTEILKVKNTITELKKFTTAAVPNLFGTRDQFYGRQYFHHWWGGAMIQVHYIQAQLLLWSPVPNRSQTGKSWGSLH